MNQPPLPTFNYSRDIFWDTLKRGVTAFS